MQKISRGGKVEQSSIEGIVDRASFQKRLLVLTSEWGAQMKVSKCFEDWKKSVLVALIFLESAPKLTKVGIQWFIT